MNYRKRYADGSYRPTAGYRIGAYGDGTSTGVIPPPGSPTLWFSAQNIDGLGNGNSAFADQAQIATWVNLGSLGSAWNMTQATAGSRPLYNLIGTAGKMRNRPGIAFNGSKVMATATGLSSQAQPITWAIVASANGSGTETYFGGAGSNAHALIASTLALQIYAGTGPLGSGQSITANAIQTITMVGNGGSSNTSIDGTQGGNVSAGTIAIDNVIIGANGASLNFLSGTVYEMVAWTGVVVSAASINAWVSSIYGATPQ